MTLDGLQAIQDEIDRLWSTERPEVVREVSAAAELGDRSENAAYIYGKKRLRAIDGRLRYLRRKIDGVIAVDTNTQVPRDVVAFGAIVSIEDEEGQKRTFRLVDKEESDPATQRISVQSPVGRALLGKEEGDVVLVRLPDGNVEMEILELRYGKGPP